MAISETEVRNIVRRVISELPLGVESDVSETIAAGPTECIFDDVDSAVAAALEAHKALLKLGLEKRERIIENMRLAAIENAEAFAALAVKETGMGRYEDKVKKNLNTAKKTPGVEDIKPEVFSGDHGLTLVERQPFGVAVCITPSTNPSETIINNGISMVAAGNSVIISPHPGAKNTTLKAVQVLSEAIKNAGGPPNVINSLAEPTIQKAQALMRHPQVDLLVATGGSGVVKEVLSSGKKAIGAGAGNPPVLVDETADIPKAARDIVAGASFDNNLPCNGEKEVLVVNSVADQLIAEMVKQGAYLLMGDEDILKLTRLVTTPEGNINKEYVGKSAAFLLEKIGIQVPKSTKVVTYEVLADHITVMEEFLMPILPVVRVNNVEEGIELAVCIEGGRHHTAVMHSTNVDNMTRFAQAIKTTIFVKNGPSYAGVGNGGEGYTTMTIAGPTGEGLTSARSFTRAQRCVLVGGFNLRA